MKQLGGKGKGSRGLLGISYDAVLDEIVNNPKYEGFCRGKWNTKRTYRSFILIPGWVALWWLENNRLGKVA